ncbi:MAG: hypothetical protein ACLUKN_09250 [Bacilli bacterium]
MLEDEFEKASLAAKVTEADIEKPSGDSPFRSLYRQSSAHR